MLTQITPDLIQLLKPSVKDNMMPNKTAYELHTLWGLVVTKEPPESAVTVSSTSFPVHADSPLVTRRLLHLLIHKIYIYVENMYQLTCKMNIKHTSLWHNYIFYVCLASIIHFKIFEKCFQF